MPGGGRHVAATLDFTGSFHFQTPLHISDGQYDCVTMPNFIAIGQTVLETYRFNDF